MTSESIAVLDDGGRMPVLKPDVAVVKVKEHWQGGPRRRLYRLVIRAPRTARIDLGVSVSVRMSVTALLSAFGSVGEYVPAYPLPFAI